VPAVTYRDANRVTASVFLSSDVAELLIYGAVDDVVSLQAETYLKKKWALK
jgi:hypothetical protein